MAIDRRDFLKSSPMALALAASGASLINGGFFASPAYAGSNKAISFLSAENLTGNWDPSSHTTLGQINFEGFVFGYLTRAPMRPENPDELVMELAESMELLDEHTLQFKLKKGVTFHTTASRSRRPMSRQPSSMRRGRTGLRNGIRVR